MSALALLVEQHGALIYLSIGIAIAIVTGYWLARM